LHRLGVEGEFENVVGLDQSRGPRPRQEIATGIAGMADADMAERIDHALVAEDAVGDGKLVAQFGKCVGHGQFPLGSGWGGGGSAAMPKGERQGKPPEQSTYRWSFRVRAKARAPE